MGCCCCVLRQTVSEKFSEEEIIKKDVGCAFLHILTTQGDCKAQGYGALVLTKEKLWYRLLCCCDDEFDIPIQEITRVYVCDKLTLPGSFVYAIPNMLVIEFSSSELAVFTMPDRNAWAKQIELTKYAQTDYGSMNLAEKPC